MTIYAFILGVVPLVNVSGSVAEMRQALGTVVFFGIVFAPFFYVLVRRGSK